MNAETRAKDLVGAIFMSGSQWGEHGWEFAQRIIAAAITQAGNDKLEEAAQRLIHRAYRLLPPDTQLVAKCAAEIRSLKSKD